MRRPDRLYLQRSSGLHDRPEHRQRWRRIPGTVLMNDELLVPEGRVVLVSGASRGIGAAIARRLYADGYTLSLGARKPEAASAALGDHDQSRVITARFDALDVASASNWIGATVGKFGRIDALINNAGILRMVRFDEGDESAMNEMWSVNVMAPFRL